MWCTNSGLPRKHYWGTGSISKSFCLLAPQTRTVYFLLMVTTTQIFAPQKNSGCCAIWNINICLCTTGSLMNEDSVFSLYIYIYKCIYGTWKANGSRNLVQNVLFSEYSQLQHSYGVWLNRLANCQATYKENYGPWGVLEKLHHWQFYLGELQGLDNVPLKYDDRLEGMYPGPFL